MKYHKRNTYHFIIWLFLEETRRNCTRLGLGDGYYKWNGAILVQETSHEYLHIIENKDYDMFLAITSEMIDENIKERLDRDNLLRIRNILIQFEREHCSDRNKKGKSLIKEEYVRKRVLIWSAFYLVP